MIINAHQLLKQASECPDPVKRISLAAAALVQYFSSMKFRQRKPFNPMLGETYELVTKEFRLLTEKVQHQPRQIMCFCFEGHEYKVLGFWKPKPVVRWNGSKGLIEMYPDGINDVYFSRFNDHITLT